MIFKFFNGSLNLIIIGMFFAFFLSIVRAFENFDDSNLELLSVPISVNVDMMQSSFKKCENIINCESATNVKSQCGKRYLASDSNHYFQYTFKGEKFQIFASKRPENGKFSLYLDNIFITTIDLKQDTTELLVPVYTSDILNYGTHTIKAVGIGQQFEIYKFTYWPSVKAKRLNISDLDIFGIWNRETDNIGGIRAKSNDKGSKIQTTIDCSKFWIFGSKSSANGEMTVKVNDKTYLVDQHTSNAPVDGNIMYESDDLPFNSYSISIENNKIDNTVSFYCIYYICEPQNNAKDSINNEFVDGIQLNGKKVPFEAPTLPPTRSPLPPPVPISVPIELMKTNIGVGNCNTDVECSNDNLNNPECGKKCWSSKSANDYFEYTFKGVKFEVYGSRASNNGEFDLLLDGTIIERINLYSSESIHRTKVYESDELEYGSHTIRVQGLANQQFEIYKFTFWPSLQAIRVNMTDFVISSGSWTVESDKIGGTRAYSNSEGAMKSGAYLCSKVWIYGSIDSNHGQMNVEFANRQNTVNETSSARQDLQIVYESEKVPFQLYALSMTRTGNKAILINFVYYLSDAPFQTPAPNPTMTPIPNSATDYIDKTFTNTLPNGQILIQTGSQVKQISGCHFVNINGTFNYMIRPETEVQIFDDVFEYTDMTKTYSMPFYANFVGSLTIRNCRFINARCSRVVGGDGNVYSADQNVKAKFDSCQFQNCGNDESQFIIRQKNQDSSLELVDCTFRFDDVTKSCKVFFLDSSKVTVNRCTFDKCGVNTLTINAGSESTTDIFQFTNNIVENSNKKFIEINGLKSKPVIRDNIFRNINLVSGYFISINHNQDEITLSNNTFFKITSSNDGKSFGGSLAAWFQRSNQDKCTIIYEKCHFYNMTNTQTTSPYNQGGAIQYGYSLSISNVSMTFEECEFIGNECQNGKGGALAFNINHDIYISKCLFEDNQASGEGGAIYIWCTTADMNNNPDVKIGSNMGTATITECQFIGNKGSEGQFLYTAEENIGDAQLEIIGCTFRNNGQSNNKYMLISFCKETNFENNTVEYLDESKTSGAIKFNKPTTARIIDSNFSKCKTNGIPCIELLGDTSGESTLYMTRCELNNCNRSPNGYSIFINNGLSEIDSVTISFDTSSNSNGGIDFGNIGFSLRNSKIIRTKAEGGIKFSQANGKTNPVLIDKCIFDECENVNKRCFDLAVKTSAFTFSNNVIQNMIARGNSGYFGVISLTNANNFVLDNFTLINNECNSDYGGGSGLWITGTSKITFERCNFINNVALKSPSARKQSPGFDYFSGDGGGIQYGFTASISNVDMIFNNCVFRENKAVRHGGAIAIQTKKTVEINSCIFEDNIANYQPSGSSELLYNNYFNLKTEGRGGAIYINPTFTYGNTNHGKLESIKIEGCTFTRNKAFDGYAIYIEGEDDGTTFIINNNNFIDNYDSNSNGKSVIISEIENLYNNQILSKNTFSYTSSDNPIASLRYVDHNALPATASPVPSETPTPPPSQSPLPPPVPISVPIELMKTNIGVGNCNTDVECSNDNLNNPECGKKCWSSKSANDYFEYTFKGVKFEVYGSRASNNGEFDLLLDGTIIERINLYSSESIHRTKVYESDELEYGSHTIRVQGLANQQFEIYKFTFWPSLQAIRVNMTDFVISSGSWTVESDKIGGTRAYSNSEGAMKSGAYLCSKVWIYGSIDSNHGQMNVEFANRQNTVNETSSARQDLQIVYESEKVPFQLYALSMTRTGNKAILINFVYYLSDAPFQTPAPNPTMTPIPNSATDYIDKTFTNTLPNGQILIQTGSQVKQISGCHFVNINGTFNYMIRPETEVQIFDDVFEYTDMTKTYSMPFYANFVGSLTIRNCRFINARCSRVVGGDGNVYSADQNVKAKFDSCQFQNCGNDESQFIIRQKNQDSSLELVDCTFRFDDVTKSCKVFFLDSSKVTVNRCTFDKCGVNTLTINAGSESTTDIFQFTNNIVENSNKKFIEINGLKSKPVIRDNIFRNINLVSGYFISINHNQDEITLSNNTFFKITSSNDGKSFGGSLAAWFQRSNQDKCTIIYEKCHFYNMTNTQTTSPYNQGGAIQYGYSLSISNVSMTFEECEFIGNECQNGKGGALAFNINHDIYISKCLFEDNQASGEGGAIYIWCTTADMNNNPDVKIGSNMGTATITECQFIGNKGSEGQFLYTAEENIGDAQLEIIGCTFRNNGQSNNKYMLISFCKETNFENNTVEYLDESKTSGAIKFNKPTTARIIDSNFSKCKTNGIPCIELLGDTSGESTLYMTRCELNNCNRSPNGYSIFINNGLSEIDSVTISFDTSSNSNGGIDFGNIGFSLRNSKIIRTKAEGGIKFSQANGKTNPVLIDKCIFDECENVNKRCFDLAVKTSAFTFSNNVIQNMIARGNSGYFGVISLTNANNFVLDNFTLINNECNSDYGGGSGLWITGTSKITFERCNFINNVALKSPSARKQSPGFDYFSGDGGGIQYGFTASISNVDMIFNNCVFRENKAVRHGGAIAIQTKKTVEINSCIFEDNIANYQPSGSSELLYNNYFNLKTEGRGGAIYINPTFTYGNTNHGKLESIKIEGCTFTRNKAFDGYAIYIEGEDDGTTFIINNNNFIDNYDEGTLSQSKSVITSEIFNIFDEQAIITSNTFSYTNPQISVAPLLYVEHNGLTPSPSPVKTGANITEPVKDGNKYTINFDCIVDRGKLKIYLSCSTCNIKNDLYFTVYFENQEIVDVQYDKRLMYPENNPTYKLDYFVDRNKIILNNDERTLSFETGSSKILYTHSENNVKCYVPYTEIVIEENECSSENRCDVTNNEPRPIHVYINISKFDGFNKTTEDGGAIHLIDCGITCTDTPFKNCESKNGGGGAIYVKNELDYINNISLVDLTFENCKAQYGGAVYIYSSSSRVPVKVLNCKFNNNEVIETSGQEITGGSAVYLRVKNALVHGCKFTDNKGSDNVLKIVSRFDAKKISRGLSFKTIPVKDEIAINECMFNSNLHSMSSIQLVIGRSDSLIEINKCVFIGELNEGSHYIDEKVVDKSNLQVLKIKSCKFAADQMKSLNLDPRHHPSLIQMDEQVYNYSESEDSHDDSKFVDVAAAIVLPALLAVLALVVAASIYLKRKVSQASDNNESDLLNNEESGL